jgi:hypothetical protein
MKLTIDNLDGLGAVDYSGAISATAPLKLARVLNEPSILSGLLELGSLGLLGTSTLAVPSRRGRVVYTAANGTILFTGYLATEAVGLYAGVGSTGSVYQYAFSAVSDEWLLDKQVPPLLGLGLAQQAGGLLETLTQRVLGGVLSTPGVVDGRSVGVYEPSNKESWSANAGLLAASTYAAYRVVNGGLTLQPAGTVTHALNFDTGAAASGGTVEVAALKTSSVKELANDVTLTGAMEPTAYIGETFVGDGTTTVFDLTDEPFRPTAANQKLLTDSFNESGIDQQIWSVTDPGSHLSLTGAGLTLAGGTGADGQTTLTAIDSVEMGGSLVIEAGNVALNSGSEGILCGLYSGTVSKATCFAGYNVTQSGGNTVLTPMVNGAAVGTAFTIAAGHLYTLRVRLHCVEMQRVLQAYYAMVNGTVESFGGGVVGAPVTLVFDLQDQGNASTTPATVLYDGTIAGVIASSPASCAFCLVDSVQMFGSIGYCTVTQTGSVWVVSTPPGGVQAARLIGIAGQGVDCKVSYSVTSKVTFFAGRVPVAGELVTVFYRNQQRAIARVEDAASVAAEAAGGASGTARWLGKVLKPAARSSMDCENAAEAVLSFATNRAAAVSGSYAALNLQDGTDVWPGDVLALTQGGVVTSVVVRAVQIERQSAWPEALAYTIAFANDWAEGLGLTLSEAIAADAVLPLTALQTIGQVLANLQLLTLVSATAAALQISAGVAPPTGGGFEVRRRDDAFGPGVDQDLVLRSPVQNFSIPREAQVEEYFVRMYDASTPPLYSRFSSAVFTDIPVS